MLIALYLGVFVAAAAATLRRPAAAPALLFALDPFLGASAIGRTTLTVPKAALLGVALALLLKPRAFGVLLEPRCRPLLFGALALVVANALTAIPCVYIDAVVRETLKALEYAAVLACCCVATVRDPDPGPFRAALIAATVAVCALALAQEFTGAPSAVFIHGHAIARIAGPLEGPNQLAGYLNVALGVLGALALFERDRVAAAAAALAAVTLVLTFSRSGIFAGFFEVALLAIIARSPRRIVAGALGAAAALIGLVAAAAGGLSRMTSFGENDAPTGLATRSQLWSAAVTLWERSPLLGVGAGNYELLLPTVPGLEGVRTHANSLYLQALAEGGLPLEAATLWTTFFSIATFLRNRALGAFVAGAGVASAALAFHQIFDCLTFFVKIGVAWWIVLGVALGRVVLDSNALEGAVFAKRETVAAAP